MPFSKVVRSSRNERRLQSEFRSGGLARIYRRFTARRAALRHHGRMPAVFRSIFLSAAWLGFFAGCLLILDNSYRDFGPGGEGVFIAQKDEAARTPLWILSLRVHIAAGAVCLLACLPQFSGTLLRRIPSLHRVCGKAYAASVLFIVCPTGIHLALSAKGGLPGQAGFLLLGIASFHTTLQGIRTIRRGDLAGHRRWMTRSFALIASAVTFRVYHVAFFHAGLPEETNYVASLWLSVLGNAAVAEWIVRRRPELRTFSPAIPSIP
jgi:hypothetical protein